MGEGLLDSRWKSESRVQLGAIQIPSGQIEYRHRSVGGWRRNPSRAPIVGGRAVSPGRMDDGGELSRRFGEDLQRLLLIRIPLGSALGSKAGEAFQSLCPAERLNIFIQNLIGGR